MGLPAQVSLLIGLVYQNLDAAIKARAFDKYRLSITYLKGSAALLSKQATDLKLDDVPERKSGDDYKKYDQQLIDWYDRNYEKVMDGISRYVDDSGESDNL
jgi:hypothetical protein